MAEEQRNPWDQREDESDAAFARFLLYRNLGPNRSVLAAYLASRGAEKSPEKPSVPGNWSDDCSFHGWPARAHAWDIHVLVEAGEDVVVAIVAVLRTLALKVLDRVTSDDFQVTDLDGVLNAVQTLCGHVPIESFREVAARGVSRANNQQQAAERPGA